LFPLDKDLHGSRLVGEVVLAGIPLVRFGRFSSRWITSELPVIRKESAGPRWQYAPGKPFNYRAGLRVHAATLICRIGGPFCWLQGISSGQGPVAPLAISTEDVAAIGV